MATNGGDVRALLLLFFLYERTLNGVMAWAQKAKQCPDDALSKFLKDDKLKVSTEDLPGGKKRTIFMPVLFETFLERAKEEASPSPNLPAWRRSPRGIDAHLMTLASLRKRRNAIMHGDPAASAISSKAVIEDLARIFSALEELLKHRVFDFDEGRVLCLHKDELEDLAHGRKLSHPVLLSDQGKKIKLTPAPRTQGWQREKVGALQWVEPGDNMQVWVTDAPVSESGDVFRGRAEDIFNKGARQRVVTGGLSLYSPYGADEDLLGLPMWKRNEGGKKAAAHGYLLLQDIKS